MLVLSLTIWLAMMVRLIGVKLLAVAVDNFVLLETLINEEACLLAMFLRNEKSTWIPRILSP
jgi:hypothetical protein